MQTLYGIKITDRVRVEEGFSQFVAFFDDERIGAFHTGKAAVNGAINFLNARAEARAIEASIARQNEADAQREADDAFLTDLAFKLGVWPDTMNTLIEIIKRRVDE